MHKTIYKNESISYNMEVKQPNDRPATILDDIQVRETPIKGNEYLASSNQQIEGGDS